MSLLVFTQSHARIELCQSFEQMIVLVILLTQTSRQLIVLILKVLMIGYD